MRLRIGPKAVLRHGERAGLLKLTLFLKTQA
jgi:hypothetical protein